MTAYTALARKWRPHSFAEMTGQEHVLRALANALASGRLHHAFLFAGTRGVGKTTVARILAKCLNCDCGVSATPCGECASCREIDAGRSVDLIEVDAASRTKVDDTRELLDNVQYAPTRSRYKIYLIDEVHMLSGHSFNALLKTLEEPPPHVKFLLATTEPQKLPVTVLSRCLQFNLKRLSVALISSRLTHILQAEQIAFEPAAVQLLAQAGDGSLRDALSLLDQLLAFGNGKALEADARVMLGTVHREQVQRVVELLAAGEPVALLDYARSFDELSPDYAQLLDQLAALFERVALKQLVPGFEGDELHPPELLARLAAQIAAEDLQLYYQTAILGRRDLALAPDARTGFRMTLIRMLAFRPATAPGAVAAPPASTPVHPGAAEPSLAPAAAGGVSAAAPATIAPAAETPVASSALDWSAIVASLELQGLPRELARNCALLGREGTLVRLALDPRGASMRTRALEDKLAQALSRYFGGTVRLQFELRDDAHETPARSAERIESQRRLQAQMAFEADPIVETFKQRFGASVLPESVRPAKPGE
ncbi:MAG TPA: DNA polymerase III subunit gamma/tau [Steroidobacteraceae bacterium]|jgi:DNA polymerase-3 subunit gamma/tau|nr:DNA polymerase III subunit gamma/tau [Steroidobacteraceae bacterium]